MVLDWTASMFLLGVALSVCPDPRVALAGCLLSLLAALVAVVWLAVYQFAIWKVMADTRGLPLVVLKEAFPVRTHPWGGDCGGIESKCMRGKRNIFYSGAGDRRRCRHDFDLFLAHLVLSCSYWKLMSPAASCVVLHGFGLVASLPC